MDAVAVRQAAVRRLARDDLDAVVDIDALAEGRSRRPYFERRLAAAIREPAQHVQFAVGEDDGLIGYILARVLEGEFGQGTPALSIEAIGARYDAKGIGVGRRLLGTLIDDAHRRGIRELRTQAIWNNHPMLRWLDDNGFMVSANHIVDCAVAGGAYAPSRAAQPASTCASSHTHPAGPASIMTAPHMSRSKCSSRSPTSLRSTRLRATRRNA